MNGQMSLVTRAAYLTCCAVIAIHRSVRYSKNVFSFRAHGNAIGHEICYRPHRFKMRYAHRKPLHSYSLRSVQVIPCCYCCF